MRKSDALKRAVCLSSFIISYGALPGREAGEFIDNIGRERYEKSN